MSGEAGRWLGLWPLANALARLAFPITPVHRPRLHLPQSPGGSSLGILSGFVSRVLGARALTDASCGRNGQLFQMSLRSMWKSPALHPESASLRPVGSLAPKSGSRQLSRSAAQWSLRSRCDAECLSSLPVFVGYRGVPVVCSLSLSLSLSGLCPETRHP